MSKFQRTFTMKVQGRSGFVHTFQTPLTCSLNINKVAGPGYNTGNFMVYNLSRETRRDIEYDSAIDIDTKGAAIFRSFEFYAGYSTEGPEPLLFTGTIRQAKSYRDTVDVITEIDVGDGQAGMQRAPIYASSAATIPLKEEIASIIQAMAPYGVSLGAIGSLFDGYQDVRGRARLDTAWNEIKKSAAANNGYACIDNQKVYVMATSDVLVIPGNIPNLNAETGLLGTPRRSANVVEAQMIFEPRLRLMQLINIQSTVNPAITGDFQVITMSHRGIISGAKDGGCVTSGSFFLPPSEVNPVTPL